MIKLFLFLLAFTLTANASSNPIMAQFDGKCMQAANSSTANGALLVQEPCNGSSAQSVILTQLNPGYYQIQFANSNLCIDTHSNNVTAGSQYRQWTCNQTTAQQFSFSSSGPGTYHIKGAHSGLCFNISGVSAANNASLIQWTCNTQLNENFSLVIPPTALAYSQPSVVDTVGTAAAADLPASSSNSGGAISNYSISPALPSGLSINAATGAISGTPSVVSAAQNYVVTGSNLAGSVQATLTLSIKDRAPTSLTYSQPSQVDTRGIASAPNTPSNQGGKVLSYSVAPALPAGLTLNSTTGVISGTPSAIVPAASYVVTAANGTGSTSATLSITVNDQAPGALAYSQNPAVFTRGVMGSDTLTVGAGGTPVSFSISPSLPAGLAFNASNGTISGNSSLVSVNTPFVIKASNSGGSSSVVLNIMIKDQAPKTLAYAQPAIAATQNVAITADSPSNQGGVITAYSVAPALPSGLSLNSTTGVISGTPSTTSAASTYTVTGLNSGGSTTASVSIAVNAPPVVAAPSALTYATPILSLNQGVAMVSDLPTSSGGKISTYAISPALPVGLNLDPVSGILSGTPLQSLSQTNFTVKGSNAKGSASAELSITIKKSSLAPANIGYTLNPAYYTVKQTISPDAAIAQGGAPTNYTISPALPSGLSFNATTGVVSGTPQAVAPMTNYLVTGTNAYGTITNVLSLAVLATPVPTATAQEFFANNNFSGVTPAGWAENFVQSTVEGMWLKSDGTIYTNSFYDENGNVAAAYQNQTVQHDAYDLHSFGRGGGTGVASDGKKYLFVGMTQNSSWGRGYPNTTCGQFYAVRRYDLVGSPNPYPNPNPMPSYTPKPYITPGATGYVNEDLFDGSGVTISEDVQDPNFVGTPTSAQCNALSSNGGALSDYGASAMGLAVANNTLYVGDYRHQSIRAFDIDTMQELPKLEITSLNGATSTQAEYPLQIATSPDGSTLWVNQRDQTAYGKARIVAYSLLSANYGSVIYAPITELVDPPAIAVDPSGQYLITADNSYLSNQVFVYDVSHATESVPPKRVNTVGTAGALFGNPGLSTYGKDAPLAFNHIIGVGMDMNGELVVASNGHGMMARSTLDTLPGSGNNYTSIRVFNLSSTLGLLDPAPAFSFEYYNYVYIDSAAFAGGGDMYTKYHHLTTDFSATGEHLNVKAVGETLDAEHYPNDPRTFGKYGGGWTRKVQGHTFQFLTGQHQGIGLAIYRFQSEVAVPAGNLYYETSPAGNWPGASLLPETPWMWTDLNGDGNYLNSSESALQSGEIVASTGPVPTSHLTALYVDDNADIWFAQERPQKGTNNFAIHHLKLLSIDAHGVPHYQSIDQGSVDTSLPNTLLGRIERFVYVPSEDTAYVSGYLPSDTLWGSDWGTIGTTVIRYNNWSNPATRTQAWMMTVPYRVSLQDVQDFRNGSASEPGNLVVAGNTLFVTYSTLGFTQAYDAVSGQITMLPVYPNSTFSLNDGIIVDGPYMTSSIVAPNGNTFLSIEEDGKGKTMFFEFPAH